MAFLFRHLRPPSRFPFPSVPALAFSLALSLLVGAPLANRPARADPTAPAEPASQSWIERSNENAKVLLDVKTRFKPEEASWLGLTEADERTMDLGPGYDLRRAEASSLAVAELRRRLEAERKTAVRQDLEILIEAAEREKEGIDLAHRLEVPYLSVPHVIFAGIRALLDDQAPPERRAKALARLRRYAGLEPGVAPLADLFRDRFRERAGDTGLVGPYRGEVERELSTSPTYVAGVRGLLEKYAIPGHEEAFAAFEKQAASHDELVRTEVLPRARSDFRLPPELYAFHLKLFGIDMPLDELDRRARVAFLEIQNEMRAMAPLVAKEKGWKLTDYHDVIRELKKKQLVGKAILPHYERRIRDLEEIIRRGRILTLPAREMRIELASEAESAAVPAPNLHPPRLIGNTGERGVFILPLRIPGPVGSKLAFDDFTFEAASWTLTAHEGRPGHEVQFARMVEKGVSLARAIFAETSVNTEGWALYAEAEAKPYEPLDGQLIALQHRLMRAARAFLDPGLQAGGVTREDATRVLRDEVCLSEAMARQEIDRYTFVDPGQAPSYFVGYNRLLEIRSEAELALGPRFDRLKFNDFVLDQGALPPRLLRQAVERELIPAQGTVPEEPATDRQ